MAGGGGAQMRGREKARRCGVRKSLLFAAAGWIALAPAAAVGAGSAPATAPGLRPDATPEEIYRALFGAASPAMAEASYPVIVAGNNQGDLLVRPGDGPEETLIHRDGLLGVLLPLLVDEKAEEVRGLRPADDRLSAADLASVGINARFDRQSLALRIEVPSQFRVPAAIALSRRSDPTRQVVTLAPAPVSGVLNVLSNVSWVERTRLGETGYDYSTVFVEGALNVLGLVLQGGLNYMDQRGRSDVQRTDVNLTYDLPGRAIRLQAGDLSSPVTALQGSPDMAGISAFRDFNLRPYETFRPAPTQEFRLDRPARVSVYVNGQFVRELRLAPGRYRLTDLPLRSAVGNDIALELRYDTGEVERVVFDAFFDFHLLKPGVSEFAFNAGFPFEFQGSDRRYDTSNPTFSGYYRRGITDSLTLGANAQLDRDIAVVGGEALIATQVGTFGLLGAWNLHEGSDGAAASLLYRWSGYGPRQPNVDIQARYAGERHFTLGSAARAPDYRYDVTARAGIDLRPTTRIQVNGSLRESWRSRSTEYASELMVMERSRYGLITGAVGYERYDRREGVVGRLTFTMPLGPGLASGSYDSGQRAGRVQFYKTPQPGMGGFGYDVGYTRQNGSQELAGGAVYNANRFEARVEQRIGSQADGAFGDEARTSASFGTALVYAGGHAALSRPVFDSFAMVNTTAEARRFQIAVDPQGQFGGTTRRYAAKSSSLGAAVTPDLSAYLVRSLAVDAPDAPAGVSVGGEVFALLPTFRSGYYLEVGSARNMSLVGRLVDPAGAPLALVAGYVVRDGGERLPIFTNAGGRLYIEGVEPGETVTLEFEGSAPLKAVIKAPDATGLVRFDEPIVAGPAANHDGRVQTPRVQAPGSGK